MPAKRSRPTNTAEMLSPTVLYSAEAEKAVLGCMMAQPDEVIVAAAEALLTTDFFIPAHQEIFRVLCRRFAREERIDVMLIHQQLTDEKLAESIGSPGILAELLVGFATHLNVASYIKIVKEKSLLRCLQLACSTIEQDIADMPDSVASVLDRAESAIMALCDPHRDEHIMRNSLTNYAEMEVCQSETVLGDRWLCRGGAALFVAPSGIGKSSAGAQMDCQWALGRGAFGIRPNGKLRILVVQVENDEGDLSEMASGVFRGLDITDEEGREIGERTRYITLPGKVGAPFFAALRRELRRFPCDLLRIDPVSAFNGADVKEADQTSWFCRQMLQPILEEFRLATILTVHTPKTNHRDTSSWKAHDWAYAAAGDAGWTNYVRAVLTVDPCEYPVFKWIASKRGGRIGWFSNTTGQKEKERHFQHNVKDDAMFWTEAGVEAIQKASKKTAEDLLMLLPNHGSPPVIKSEFQGFAVTRGFGRNDSRSFLDALLHSKLVQEVSVPAEFSGRGSRNRVGLIRVKL